MAVFIGAIGGKFTAKTKKNSSNFNKAVYWAERYNALNDMRNSAEDNDDMKAYRKFDRQCENAYDKYTEYLDNLPKYEQKKIEKIIFG